MAAIVFNLLAILLITNSIAGWAYILVCLFQGRAPLKTEPRPLPPNPLLDTILHGLTIPWMVLVSIVAYSILAELWNLEAGSDLESLDPEQRILLVKAVIVATTATLLAALPIVLFRYASHWRDLGRQLMMIPRDLLLGVVAFSVLAPPVLLVQMLLTHFVSEKQHPFIEVLLEEADLRFFVMAVVAAVVVAPVGEEFFFRVLIQGLLERVSALPGWQLFVDSSDPLPAPTGEKEPAGKPPLEPSAAPVAVETLPPQELPGEAALPPIAAVDEAAAGRSNPWLSPQAPPPARTPAPLDPTGQPAYWPIFVSSLLFSLAHLGQGPAPFSLFLFALGLGYVYRCTHRVLPCIVMHMSLNALSMAQLWLLLPFGGK